MTQKGLTYRGPLQKEPVQIGIAAGHKKHDYVASSRLATFLRRRDTPFSLNCVGDSAHRVLNVAVAEIGLECPGIMSSVGQCGRFDLVMFIGTATTLTTAAQVDSISSTV